MAGPNQIIIDSNVNDISLDVTNNIIEVVDNNCPAEIQITQPVTRVVEVATVGPQGPVGPKGFTHFMSTGSVTASVALTGDIFNVSFCISRHIFNKLSRSLNTSRARYNTRPNKRRNILFWKR